MNKFKLFKIAGLVGNQTQTDGLSTLDFLKAYFRLFKNWLQGNYSPKKRNLLIGFLVLVYVISPIDLLPAIILDDAVVVFFALKYFKKELNRFLVWEKSRNYPLQFSEAEIIHD